MEAKNITLDMRALLAQIDAEYEAKEADAAKIMAERMGEKRAFSVHVPKAFMEIPTEEK